MTSPYITKHVISFKLSHSQLFRFQYFLFEVSFFEKFLLKLKDSFVDLSLYMERVAWNIVWWTCLSNENLEMKQFTTDGGLYVSNTDGFLSAKISFKNWLIFFGNGSNRLSHPVCQINSVYLRIKFGLSTNINFKLGDWSVRIEYFLNHCILRHILEFRLKLSFDTNITFDWYLPSLNSELDELFSKIKFEKLFRIMIDVIQSVSIQISQSSGLFFILSLCLQNIFQQRI